MRVLITGGSGYIGSKKLIWKNSKFIKSDIGNTKKLT